MNMKEKFSNWIRAGYACLDILTHEENRAIGQVCEAVHETGSDYKVYIWSVTKGLIQMPTPGTNEYFEPEEADEFDVLDKIEQMDPFSVVFLKDYHMFIEPTNGMHVRRIRDLLEQCRSQQKCVIMVGCRKVIPPELEREVTIVDFPLPEESDFTAIIDDMLSNNPNLQRPDDEQLRHSFDSMKGQTILQVENSIGMSAVCGKPFDPVIISEEKSQNIRQSGLLEVIPVNVTRADIGGLENYIECLEEVHGMRRPEVIALYPNTQVLGFILGGPPGTGKSLACEVTAAELQLPLFRLDVPKLKGGIVGESEGNMRTVLKLLKANAPCVCQMDEVEKMLSGVESSGKTDGGTTSGMFSQLLTAMQGDLEGVFFVATCNDMSILKPEFIRRFSDAYFVDFPNPREREIIWRIHLNKQKLKVEDYDLEVLSSMTDGYTGAEIEKSVTKGIMMTAWKDEVATTDTMMEAIERVTPISLTMKEEVARIRKWCATRTQMAGKRESVARTEPKKGRLLG
jgi:AAA+ superfamily predicted ATPase